MSKVEEILNRISVYVLLTVPFFWFTYPVFVGTHKPLGAHLFFLAGGAFYLILVVADCINTRLYGTHHVGKD